MRRRSGLFPFLMLLSAAVKCNSISPPGKPVLLGCRSPEKETFTCWWEPGSDGGLPTTHSLHYTREGLTGTLECPDYRSAGRNSCFFDRDHTSIWVDYYLTVEASNALGNATSDPLKIDVVEIVKPNAPENVTLLLVEERGNSPYLHVSWERPRNTDTKSGWVTIKYELKVKQGNSDNWKEYMSGTQTYFNLYSVSPGTEYAVQVRCRLDHSAWSEWSKASVVKISDYLQSEGLFWIMLSTILAFPLIAAMCILLIKRENVKKYVLPPVPGPKIKGVDFRLLKGRLSEDISSDLITEQNFPLMVGWKDMTEDFVVVTDNHGGSHFAPYNSLKRKRSLTVPTGFRFESKNFMKSEATDRDAVNLFTTGGYVDVPRHENKQEVDYSRVKEVNGGSIVIVEKENLLPNGFGYIDVETREKGVSADYSRVKEVHGDNMVYLQKQNVDTSPKEKVNRCTDFALQKPRNPHQGEVYTGLMDGGYVETTPSPIAI